MFKNNKFKIGELPSDIIKKINEDFVDDSGKVIDLFNGYLLNSHEKGYERVIRCIIFLAKKSVKGIEKGIQQANIDSRDVMFWAEYVELESDTPKRVRDFKKPFNKNDLNIFD